MTRFSTPVRGVLAAATLSVLALSVSACNGAHAPAAKVNGHEINGDARFLQAAQLFAQLIPTSATTAAPKTTDHKIATPVVTSYLNERIDEAVLHQLALRNGVVATAAEKDQVERSIAQSVTGTNGTKAWSKYPAWFRTQFVDVRAEVSALTRKYAGSDDGTAAQLAAYNANKSSFTKYCLDGLSVSTSADASAVISQIRGGASFASVVASITAKKTGAAAGTKATGDLGCVDFSGLAQVDQFLTQAQATDLGASKDGDVLGPLSAGPSFLVLRLRSRSVQPFAEVQSQIASALPAPGQTKFNAELVKALKAAKVQVDPRFGKWGPTAQGTPGIAAPKGAELPFGVTTTTAAPAAATAN